jgi:ankyrin repeat protein
VDQVQQQIAMAGTNVSELVNRVVDGSTGNTALHVACINAHATVAKMLIDHAANVDAKNIDGNTVMHAACIGGDQSIVMMMMQAGAKIVSNVCERERELHASVCNHTQLVQSDWHDTQRY